MFAVADPVTIRKKGKGKRKKEKSQQRTHRSTRTAANGQSIQTRKSYHKGATVKKGKDRERKNRKENKKYYKNCHSKDRQWAPAASSVWGFLRHQTTLHNLTLLCGHRWTSWRWFNNQSYWCTFLSHIGCLRGTHITSMEMYAMPCRQS